MFDGVTQNFFHTHQDSGNFLASENASNPEVFLSLSLSLSSTQDFVRRDQIQIRKPKKARKKVTKISLKLNSNLGGDPDLPKSGMTNASLLELQRFEATHNSFPPTAISQFSTFFEFNRMYPTECIQFNSI